MKNYTSQTFVFWYSRKPYRKNFNEVSFAQLKKKKKEQKNARAQEKTSATKKCPNLRSCREWCWPPFCTFKAKFTIDFIYFKYFSFSVHTFLSDFRTAKSFSFSTLNTFTLYALVWGTFCERHYYEITLVSPNRITRSIALIRKCKAVWLHRLAPVYFVCALLSRAPKSVFV